MKRSAQMRRVYDALEERGLLENAWFILGSDHGDHTGEKGRFNKSESTYECLLHVPLAIRAPEGSTMPRGKRIDHIVNLVDLFPTILGLAGIEPPVYSQGHDLARRTARIRSSPGPRPGSPDTGVRVHP